MNDWIDPEVKTPTREGYVFVWFTSMDLEECCGKPPVMQVGLGEYVLGSWYVNDQENTFSEECQSVHGWMPITWPEPPEVP